MINIGDFDSSLKEKVGQKEKQKTKQNIKQKEIDDYENIYNFVSYYWQIRWIYRWKQWKEIFSFWFTHDNKEVSKNTKSFAIGSKISLRP